MLLAEVPACEVSLGMAVSPRLLRERVLLAQGQAAKKVPIDGLTLGPVIVAAGRSTVYKGSFNGMAVSVKVGVAQGPAPATVASCGTTCQPVGHVLRVLLSCVPSLSRQCDQALMQDSPLHPAGLAGSAAGTRPGAVQVSQMPVGAGNAAQSPLPC